MKKYKHSRKSNFNFRNVLSLIMAFVMLFTIFSSVSHLVSIADDGQKPYIMLDGERVENVVLQEDAKLRLYAIASPQTDSFKWQISHPEKDNCWVNISGMNSDKIWLTAALVSSMTDASGQVSLRCAVTSNTTEFFTDPVKVILSYNTGSNATEAVISTTSQKLKRSARATTDEHITYSVVINYLFENNSIAFEPYGATIAAGSNFTDPIESPSIVGYEPFRLVGDEYISADYVYPEIYNIEQNITINVIYKPAMVKFYIHHHKQDIYDDFYSVTPDRITEGTAPTGTKVGDGLAFTEEEWPGLKALAYERLEVAADSSTAIEIRYDRKYYFIDFDMDGGYGTEPVYTRFEATIGANAPIRHGYIFDGWELVSYGGKTPTAEQKAMYDINGKTISVPAANLSYKARWIVGETKYTMVFWCENPDDNGYSYWGCLENLPAMSGDILSAQDLIRQVEGIDDEEYFQFNPQKSDKNVMIEGDGSTIINAYYTRKLYTITFKATGLCTLDEKHQHTDKCYEAICGLSHVHDNTCVSTLTCQIALHTAHTEECIACDKTVHTHGSDDCQCNKKEHAHSLDCWNNVGSKSSKPSLAQNNPSNGYIGYSFSGSGSSNYRIYLFGSWYLYTGDDVYYGMVKSPDCKLDEHAHGVDCSCSKEEHTHDDSCYKDELHTHGENCYSYSCGQDEHTHVDACYRLMCSQPTNHSHTTDCKNSKKTNTVKLVKEKYGHFLGDVWPVTDENKVVYDSGQRWSPSSSSYYTKVLVYISQMPPDDFTLSLSTTNADTYTMKYYMEVLEGSPYETTYENLNYDLENTIVANYNYVTEDEDFFKIKGFYQYKSDPAFKSGQIDLSNGGEVKFYYKRITDHYLKFYNNGLIMDNKSVYGIPYESPLTEYNFTPEYPSNLEPGAYEFDGWYTSPGCYDGTQVDWNNITMTEGDLMLYAKWKPTVHKVRVFIDADKKTQIGETLMVPHGNFAPEPIGTVTNGNFIFQGWFYMDEGKEKAFVFRGFPINEDLDVYAKWSSHVEIQYKIYYKLKDTDTFVADPTIGTSIAGNNKTFEAKVEDALYEEYRSGYYPDVASHTITMSVTGDHTFTFWYDYVESVPYTVRYVDEFGNEVHPSKTIMDNRLSVVTETFVRIDDKMPDAYQKRLILTSTGEDINGDQVFDNNVITFHYSSDTEHAYYRVVHYVENVMKGTYHEYRSEETIGLIGEEYTIKAITLTGFEYVPTKTNVVGNDPTLTDNTVTVTLGKDGLLIELYYDRVPVNYMVQYVDSEYRPLIAEKQGQGIFGEQILEYAPDLSDLGYSLVSENLKMLTLSAVDERNVIVFMYQEITATIKYEIVGPANCGTLVPQTENIKAVTGDAKGSLPTAEEGFTFIGWYYDAHCTQKVDEGLVNEGNLLIPEKQDGIWKDKTYYAKFEPLDTSLTIALNGVSHLDNEQAFFFTLKGVDGTDTEDVNLTVCITGNGTTTVSHLPIGKYTITYHNDWAWRFKQKNAVTNLNLEYNEGSNSISYTVSRNNNKWLDGQHGVNNIF